MPTRIISCAARNRSGGDPRHEPGRNTVESESSLFLEWQFGTCMYCAQTISRFRKLNGGRWFDSWGNLEESAYTIPTDLR